MRPSWGCHSRPPSWQHPWPGSELRTKGQPGGVLAQEGSRQGGGLTLGENCGAWLPGHGEGRVVSGLGAGTLEPGCLGSSSGFATH